jgi:hypothetical protein
MSPAEHTKVSRNCILKYRFPKIPFAAIVNMSYCSTHIANCQLLQALHGAITKPERCRNLARVKSLVYSNRTTFQKALPRTECKNQNKQTSPATLIADIEQVGL